MVAYYVTKIRPGHLISYARNAVLASWLNKWSFYLSLAIPMIWREPKNHCRNCCFFLTKTKSFFFKQRHKIAYPNLDSARTQVPHNMSMPLPVLPQDFLDAIDCSANEDNVNKFISAKYTDSEYHRRFHLIFTKTSK